MILNRFNVSLTAYQGFRDFTYFPSIAEMAVSVGFVAAMILAFDLGVRYLPVYEEHAKEQAT